MQRQVVWAGELFLTNNKEMTHKFFKKKILIAVKLDLKGQDIWRMPTVQEIHFVFTLLRWSSILILWKKHIIMGRILNWMVYVYSWDEEMSVC